MEVVAVAVEVIGSGVVVAHIDQIVAVVSVGVVNIVVASGVDDGVIGAHFVV